MIPSAQLPPAGARFLLVDDDERLRERLARALRSRGYEVYTAPGADQALATAASVEPAFAVIDLRMPGRSGLELVRDLVQRQPELQAVILTGYGSIPTAVDAIRLGAVNYLAKPADADMVLAAFAHGADEPLVDPPAYDAPSLARTEWEHIQRVLEDCGGNISEASRRLGLHRRTLQRKLQKYPPRQ